MKTISPNEALQLIQKEKITLIDVREEEEFAQSYIAGAQLCSLSDLPQTIQSANIPDGDKVIFYCLKGGRSAKAIEFVSENICKDKDVYNLEGGIKAWAEQDLPLIYPEEL